MQMKNIEIKAFSLFIPTNMINSALDLFKSALQRHNACFGPAAALPVNFGGPAGADLLLAPTTGALGSSVLALSPAFACSCG